MQQSATLFVCAFVVSVFSPTLVSWLMRWVGCVSVTFRVVCLLPPVSIIRQTGIVLFSSDFVSSSMCFVPPPLAKVNDYWEECRGLYAPFESGQKSGSADVYNHEMPGKSPRPNNTHSHTHTQARLFRERFSGMLLMFPLSLFIKAKYLRCQ